jgi:hypothetical protein
MVWPLSTSLCSQPKIEFVTSDAGTNDFVEVLPLPTIFIPPVTAAGLLCSLLPLKMAEFLGGFSTIFLQSRLLAQPPPWRTYIPQRQRGPVIPSGTGYPF